MFSKLLKYDMRSLRRFGMPILLGILGIGVAGSFCVALLINRVMNIGNSSEVEAMLDSISMSAMGFALFFLIFGLIGAVAVMTVFIYVHFYKNLVSDEGYLTFTLPVNSRDIILSKLVSSMIWSVATTVAVIIAVVAMVLSGFWAAGAQLSEIFEDGLVFEMLYDFYGFTGVSGALAVVLMILNYIISAATSTLLCFLAIFLASVIVKKNKVLTAIGLIVGFSFGYSIVNNIIGIIVSAIFGVTSYSSTYALGYNVSSAVMTVIVGGMGVLFYYLLKNLMDKKLNLS